MSEKPLDLIEKYLDRVRVYLPIDSEDVLIEIRTHLLEEAESIGDGSITRGSTMMAIERFGDPKDAANAAAGTFHRSGGHTVTANTGLNWKCKRQLPGVWTRLSLTLHLYSGVVILTK